MMDSNLFGDIVQYSTEVKAAHAQRDVNAERWRKMYMLEWDEKDNIQKVAQHIRPTVHPMPRNKAIGGKRLLTATEVSFSVPEEKGVMDKRTSSLLEKIATAMWWRSGQAYGRPLEDEASTSGIVYDEVHIVVEKTEDMVKHSKGASKAAVARVEKLAEETPYLFTVQNPEGCYPVWDKFGLRSYYRERVVTKGDIIDEFGKAGEVALGIDRENASKYDEIILCDFWDLEYRQVWIQDGSVPILQEEHGLPFIPIACRLVEGSMFFDGAENQRQGFFYTLDKSEIWKRLNLILTMITTQAFSVGLTTQFIFEEGEGSSDVIMDPRNLFAILRVTGGGKLTPLMQRGLYDPEVIRFMSQLEGYGTESTIYDQTLGEPIGKGETFSTTALLNQAGRLPLTTIQRQVSAVAADAVMMAFEWMRHDGGTYRGRSRKGWLDLKASDIPDHLVVEANLEIDLPQDRLQMASTAERLQGMVSKAWALENILNIGQPEEMIKQVWTERLEDSIMGTVAKMLQDPQALMGMLGGGLPGMQQPQAPPMQGQPPSQGMPSNGGMPPGMEEQMMQEMMGGAAPPAPPLGGAPGG